MDRRIQKTRKVIMETFIALMGVKDFEKITINEIAEQADVNRGTIYLHFVDKYDLLDQCIATYMEHLVQYCRVIDECEEPSTYKGLSLTFNFLEKNFKSYAILMNKEGARFFREQLSQLITQMLQQLIKKVGQDKGISDEITVQFLTSAIVGIIEWWITNEMPCTVEEVTKKLWELLLPFKEDLLID
jgi:AcrR family transcriptional regulator